jgi:hypothetical protein
VVDLLEDVPSDGRDRIEEERQLLTEWLNGVVIRPRFPTPTEKRLRG